jgi:uncharacterized membrane protein
VNRIGVLYFVTLVVLTALDFLFLGLITKGFFTSEIGDMLGELKPLPAILFYLLYVVGVLIFISGSAGATWQCCSTGRCSGCFAMRRSISPRWRCPNTGAGRSRSSTSAGVRW